MIMITLKIIISSKNLKCVQVMLQKLSQKKLGHSVYDIFSTNVSWNDSISGHNYFYNSYVIESNNLTTIENTKY